MSKTRFIFILLLLKLQVVVYGQNVLIDSLLSRISDLQQTNSTFYLPGNFASQRVYLKKKDYSREDDNIFFTGLIVWTLQTYESRLTLVNHKLVDSICNKAIKNYPYYRNKDGGVTYNFWKTNPAMYFPNDNYFSRRKKYQLPDDLDDTAILFHSTIHSDTDKAILKRKMTFHANRNKKTIKNTFREFKHKPAYSTWFGKKMPIDFDICVQANALLFVLNNKLPIDESDIETAHLLTDVVKKNYHLKFPHFVSPHYQNSAIILYHISRLISLHKEYGLGDLRAKVVEDIYSHLLVTINPFEKLLLENSLLKLGICPKSSVTINHKDFNDFYFFVANMTSTMVNPFKRWLAKSKRTNFYYKCEAYYYTLLFENACLRLSQ